MIDPHRLLLAYASGSFPMASSRTGAIEWFSPDPRGIIDLNEFRIARSLRRTLRSGVFDIRVDTAFGRVMHECAEREETWISDEIIASYGELHRLGFAHSVEAWHADQLVGGLYGVALGAAFFGESMFSRETDASKVALAALVERLRQNEYLLLDTQYTTPHLESLGAKDITRTEYLERLAVAIARRADFAKESRS
jgi:leucyl/phenylalanyl-tRNA---protein transferase